MSIISQNIQKSELSNAISSFFSSFRIGNLLRKCNAGKEKGVSVIDIFKYKLCNVFKKGSSVCRPNFNSLNSLAVASIGAAAFLEHES